jgi:hypothetical protein
MMMIFAAALPPPPPFHLFSAAAGIFPVAIASVHEAGFPACHWLPVPFGRSLRVRQPALSSDDVVSRPLG